MSTCQIQVHRLMELSIKERIRLLGICLILLLLLFYQLVFFGAGVVKANTDSISILNGGPMIDLFTQKEPYSGRGANISSDAFAPGSLLILFASVKYNEEPVEYMSVAFQVIPPNPAIPTFFGEAPTNASGIAMTGFPLPGLNLYSKEVVFGTWFAIATVRMPRDVVVVDTLTFKVGWIVEIVSLSTIDENLNPKSYFPKATCIGVKLQLKNIAMLPKTATVVINAYDGHNEFFDSIVLNNFNVEPGPNTFCAHCYLNVSEEADIGNAMLNASVYTAPPSMGGYPYCPEVLARFMITDRNVAVTDVTISSVDVAAGEIVEVTVTVANKGNETEDFSVSAYYGTFLIQTFNVTSLPPDQSRTIIFVWNTTYVQAGVYEISAVASRVPGETYVDDNSKSDGVITIRVPWRLLLPRELSIVVLVVVAALALFAMAIILSRKKTDPQPVMLNVDVIPS